MYKDGIERNQVGPVGSAVAGMAALLVAWGCEPQPPEACGTVQDQTVNMHQTVRVTPCFTDPDGDELVLSAESSDPAVADVSVTRAAVSVRGAGVGGAAVVVTAKDHHGLQARTRFGVAVPNRAPELTKPFDTLTAEIGRSRYVALGKHFTDPDGHAMSYGIGSVDSSAVAAVVENSRLHISGRAEGQTEVTVIASDGRDSSEATVRVRVPEPVRSFRDDFDSEESLADWTRVRAGVSVEDGRLHVSPDTTDEGYAHRYAGEAPAAARWRIKVSMASADSAGVAGVRWQAKGGSHRAYFFSIGGGTTVADSVNWELGVCYPSGPCMMYVDWTDQYGWSDDIEVGVLQEFHIWMEGDLAYVRIGEDGPWLVRGVKPDFDKWEITSTGLHGRFELGAFNQEAKDHAAVYDWVELVVK